MKSISKIVLSVIMIFSLAGCEGSSGGGDSVLSNNSSNQTIDSGNNNDNQVTDNRIALKLEKSYSIPIVYGSSNVLLDGESLILAGGQTGTTTGATHDGSPLFSNKVIKWNLLDGTKQTLEMNATTGHLHDGGDKGTGGRGNWTTIIYKLDSDKYLIAGGFQYENSIEIADFLANSVIKITTLEDITDSSGLNTTSFYANNQGNAPDNDGNIYWFGFNNGLYDDDSIMKFNRTTEEVELLGTKLTIPRTSVSAHTLSSGKIILIGGWNGSNPCTEIGCASRRAEIFDPETLTIEKISDYPEPATFGQQHIGQIMDKNDIVCVNKIDGTYGKTIAYQYSIQDDEWKTGCDLNTTTITNEDFSYQGGVLPGRYLGKLSNGNVVFINDGMYSSIFSDAINGYPLETNTTIDIYSIQ